jgi:hypothetical protein
LLATVSDKIEETSMMKTTSNKYYVLAIAVLLGASGAWLSRSTESTGSVAAHRAQNKMDASSTRKTEGTENVVVEGGSNDLLRGKVQETIDVQNYTYLRIKQTATPAEKNELVVWAAIPKSSVKIGQEVTIVGAQRMEGFKSTTLKRTFDVIYFGELRNGAGSMGQLPAGQLPAGQLPAGQLPAGHPKIDSNGVPWTNSANESASRDASNVDMAAVHGTPKNGILSVPVGSVARAPGSLGYTVAEVVRSRKELQGKNVRVRGIVVKSTSGVLGKTFVHVQDGSGSESNSDFDLTITTAQDASVGSKVLFEGVVVIDKDFGAGYRYPVLVENARRVDE